MTYKVSRNIIISPVHDYFDGDVPAAYQNGYYILDDEKRKREFLINDTIKYFIDKFSVPKTQAEVLKELEVELSTNASEFEDTCSSFFKYLTKRKILIPSDVDESFMGNNCLFEEGDKVDNYLVEKVLANKNNIDIYLVSDVDHQMYVLKLLNQQKLGTEKDFKKALKELKKEYEVLCNLNNVPSISHVFGFNEEHDTFCYFVMEYIDGRSISRHLEEHEELSIQAALQLIEGIIKAFSLLHTANLIHGDIHSANVLVLPDQSIKIIDVGLSRNVQPEKEQVLKFGGVHHYMPPERINITTSNKYSKEPDLYSDVYQIGLLAYLVLYNHLPFDGFIWEELAKNIKEQEAEFPEKSFSGYSIPNALIDVIKKCTSKNATDRYANAGEILKDFKLRL